MINQISPREKEILQYLCKGLTTKEIAKLIHRSTHTIVSHRKSLNEKLDVKTGVELGVKAMEYNLIERREVESLYGQE